MTAERLTIFDTTLRDGEQAPGFSLRIDEKLQLARQLDALGVDIIEAGFPIASKDDAESVRRIAREVRRPIIASLARCRRADIECAGETIKGAARSRIHTFLPWPRAVHEALLPSILLEPTLPRSRKSPWTRIQER